MELKEGKHQEGIENKGGMVKNETKRREGRKVHIHEREEITKEHVL